MSSGFGFGNNTTTTQSSGFSFGNPGESFSFTAKTTSQTAATNAFVTPGGTAPSGGFSFGNPASTSAQQPSQTSGFSFGSLTSGQVAKPNFGFATPSTTKPAFGVGATATTSSTSNFGFGTSATSASQVSGFGFGSSTGVVTAATNASAFGTSLSSTTKPSSGFSFGGTAASTTGFNFSSQTPAASKPPTLGFGSAPVSQTQSGGLNFNSKPAQTTAQSGGIAGQSIASFPTKTATNPPAFGGSTLTGLLQKTSAASSFTATSVAAKPDGGGFQLSTTSSTSATGFSLTGFKPTTTSSASKFQLPTSTTTSALMFGGAAPITTSATSLVPSAGKFSLHQEQVPVTASQSQTAGRFSLHRPELAPQVKSDSILSRPKPTPPPTTTTVQSSPGLKYSLYRPEATPTITSDLLQRATSSTQAGSFLPTASSAATQPSAVKPSLQFGATPTTSTPSLPTTTSKTTEGLSLGFKLPAASTTLTSKPAEGLSLGFKLPAASTTATSKSTEGISSGFKLPTTSTTEATSTAPGLATSLATSTAAIVTAPALKYKELEAKINKWKSELEQQEHLFITQATQVNAWSKLLISNAEKITALNDEFEKVTCDQERLNQELDFIKSQQDELEDLLAPLEEATKKQMSSMTSSVHTHHADVERERTCNLAEAIDGQLKRMGEDLREVIEHVNASSASGDATNPVTQISKILSAHMDSLQWLDTNSGALQHKLDQLTKQVNERKVEQESRLRLAFD